MHSLPIQALNSHCDHVELLPDSVALLAESYIVPSVVAALWQPWGALLSCPMTLPPIH